jgi:hypothetical protein
MVQCDIPRCRRIDTVTGSGRWLIPAWPDMPTYCPDCFALLALLLIGSALSCPCGSSDIQMHITNIPSPDGSWTTYADCAVCGLVLITDQTPNYPEF